MSTESSTRVADLTPDEMHDLVHSAVAHAMRDQLPLVAQVGKDVADSLTSIQKDGVPTHVRSGIAIGVFLGLLLWTITPALLFLAILIVGGTAADLVP